MSRSTEKTLSVENRHFRQLQAWARRARRLGRRLPGAGKNPNRATKHPAWVRRRNQKLFQKRLDLAGAAPQA